MIIDTLVEIGDKIYIYDPEDGYESEKQIDNILICKDSIILKSDAYDDIICDLNILSSYEPDEGGLYYFTTKLDRDKFKEECNNPMIKIVDMFPTLYRQMLKLESIKFPLIDYLLALTSGTKSDYVDDFNNYIEINDITHKKTYNFSSVINHISSFEDKHLTVKDAKMDINRKMIIITVE